MRPCDVIVCRYVLRKHKTNPHCEQTNRRGSILANWPTLKHDRDTASRLGYIRHVAKARTLLGLSFGETIFGRAVDPAVLNLGLYLNYENGVMVHTCASSPRRQTGIVSCLPLAVLLDAPLRPTSLADGTDLAYLLDEPNPLAWTHLLI